MIALGDLESGRRDRLHHLDDLFHRVGPRRVRADSRRHPLGDLDRVRVEAALAPASRRLQAHVGGAERNVMRNLGMIDDELHEAERLGLAPGPAAAVGRERRNRCGNVMPMFVPPRPVLVVLAVAVVVDPLHVELVDPALSPFDGSALRIRRGSPSTGIHSPAGSFTRISVMMPLPSRSSGPSSSHLVVHVVVPFDALRSSAASGFAK